MAKPKTLPMTLLSQEDDEFQTQPSDEGLTDVMAEMEAEFTKTLPSHSKLQELLTKTLGLRVACFSSQQLPEEFAKWPTFRVPELVSLTL